MSPNWLSSSIQVLQILLSAPGGAEGKSAISTLLKLIQKAPAKADAQDAQLTLRVKKKKAQQALVRPLIAICNDLYAPVLRTLRNVAQVVSFKQPQVGSVEDLSEPVAAHGRHWLHKRESDTCLVILR